MLQNGKESESEMVVTYVARRHGHKWSIPEELRLQREYELLELPMDYIAYLHRRTYEGIVAKVEKEEFVRSIYADMDMDMNVDMDMEDKIDDAVSKSPSMPVENIMVFVAVSLFLCLIMS
jgi:hypothetical protein